ncbi:MAG TPA: glutamine--fructose-6-phosphate transaminase (isomerizing) [Acidobacteriota bacterium]
MCGIVGMVGGEDVSARLLHALSNLEYRGYDSCGAALFDGAELKVRKNVGTVEEVIRKEALAELHGAVGIAHTRWATTGAVTQANAHPHLGGPGRFAVVHNGILSNYRSVKQRLVAAGYQFVSETDTEVFAHALDAHFRDCGEVEEALARTTREFEGAYAIVVLSRDHPDRLLAVRDRTPLVIGVGPGRNYIASDPNAFIADTQKMVPIEDGEIAVVTRSGYALKRLRDGDPIARTPITLAWSGEVARKGGYPHFMLKEIHEQPQAVRAALAADPATLRALAERLARAERAYLIGVGTTYYVAMLGQYLARRDAELFAPALSSDEFEHVALVDERTQVLAISQSGETYDTMRALRFAAERGARTAAILNVMGSTLYRTVDLPLLQASGPEVCVVSTKAALAQMVLLSRLAIELGRVRGTLSEADARGREAELGLLPEVIDRILNEQSGLVRELARRHMRIRNWMVLGRGLYYPLALESALKVKEVSYLHAEGMPGGFLKHGTLSLVGDDMFTLVLMPPPADKDLYEQSLTSAEEVKARRGTVIGFTYRADAEVFDHTVVLPSVPSGIAHLPPLILSQLFAYFLAVQLRHDPDKPRFLAKSVTVA